LLVCWQRNNLSYSYEYIWFCDWTLLTLNKYPLNHIQATCLYICHINTLHSPLLRYRSSKSRIHDSVIHHSAWVSARDVRICQNVSVPRRNIYHHSRRVSTQWSPCKVCL
jgi:hypothetical protein